MIATVIALAATATASGHHDRLASSSIKLCVLTRTCLSMDRGDDQWRIVDTADFTPDSKMDAYRVNSRPCGIVGNMRCAKKGREVVRVGEPVRETLARSLGLD